MLRIRRWWREAAFSVGLVGLAVACGEIDTSAEIRELHAEGRFRESIEPLRALLEAHPKDPELHYLHGIALVRAGEPRSAIWSLRKAAEQSEWLVPASLELASADLGVQNWSGAIEAANRVIAAEPDNRRALFVRGEAELGRKAEPDRALADFDRLLELEPDHHAAELRRAAALIMLDRVDEASAAMANLEAKVQEASLDADFQAHLCTTRAVFEAERAELEAAEASFGECLERFPTNATVLGEAMGFFDTRNESARATALLEGALEKLPQSLSYRAELAGRLRTAGDVSAAEAVLRAGLELDHPQLHAGIWTELTNHYLTLNDLAAAVDAYEEALALAPEPSALAILTHADLLARAGQHARALEVAEQLEDDAYRGLVEARVHLNEGRPAEALARFDTVFPAWPDNAGARYYAARAAEQLGDFERAMEEYRQSLRSGPEHSEAGLRLAKLLSAAGAPQLAWTGANHHFQAHPQDPEAVRVLLGLAAEGGSSQLEATLRQLRSTPHWARALAIRVDTIAAQQGPEAALEAIGRHEALDLTQPRAAPLLRSLVVQLAAAGRLTDARARVDAALIANPESADVHEIQGLLLQAEGAAPENVRAAYLQALAYEPRQAHALAALGELEERAEHWERALEYYDRATQAAFENPEPGRRAAQLVARRGQLDLAEERWERLLREHPWDAATSIALTQLRLDRGDTSERSLELARRAVMFGGGAEAHNLLIRIHEARGEADQAAEVTRRLEAAVSRTAIPKERLKSDTQIE